MTLYSPKSGSKTEPTETIAGSDSTLRRLSAAERLPVELLDQIIGYVRSFDTRSILFALWSVSLTCKRWLEPGRRGLFDSPLLRLALRDDWIGANLLLSSLQANPGLASLVRDLYQVDDATAWVSHHFSKTECCEVEAFNLAELDLRDLVYDEQESPEIESVRVGLSNELIEIDQVPWTWAMELVRACPNASRLGLQLHRSFYWPHRLANAVPYPNRSIRIPNRDGKTDEIYQLPPLPNKLASLSLRSSDLTITELQLYLPSSLANLGHVSFHLDSFSQFSFASSSVVSLLGPFIRSLEVHIVNPRQAFHNKNPVSNPDWSRTICLDLPTPLYSLDWPHLSHLKLRYIQNISAEMLVALDRGSPNLRDFDADWCAYEDFDEGKTLENLLRDGLRNLEYLHLGMPDLAARRVLGGAQSVAESRGLRLEFRRPG